MKSFYLTGHRTFGNRGCEAIVRSTAATLREVYGQVTILVPSDNIERDAMQWPEASANGVKFVPAYESFAGRFWLQAQRRLPIPFLKRAGWPFPFPRWLKDQIASVDAVLAVGGDNYSLDYGLPSFFMGMDQLAMDMGKPVYLWGASVGPFEREPHFVPVIREHLARMDQILVRESISYNYLTETLGLSNVRRMADPAFRLEKQEVDCSRFWPDDPGNGVIGINVSPLIERYKDAGQDLIAEVVSFIRHVATKGKFGVLLVPHVMPWGQVKNNDADYMARILSACDDLGSRITMIPRTFNAAQIKAVISRLRFFIGARTHSTIAALSSGVPTISITYSVKARGINRDIFGDEWMVVPTPQLSCASLTTAFGQLVEREEEVRARLNVAIPKLQESIISAATALVIRHA